MRLFQPRCRHAKPHRIMPIPREFTAGATALVTGGARRIGAAMVQALADDGWHVAIHCHTSRAAADAIAATLPRATVVQGDLASPTIGAELFAQLAAAPPVACLVNNASRFEDDKLIDFTAEAWDRHLAINLRAPALLTQAFAGQLAGNGAIINLLDAKLAAPNPDFFSYTISKMGLAGLTELAARALAPAVRVNAIAPAVTLVSGPQSRENFAAAHVLNPLRRGVDAEHLVAALRFILATPTLTGQTLTIDSGQRFMGLPRDVAQMVAS
jgi:NAD(P)-dependent dehydrogenase (short-subunit alcohol dehydrogenase family)